MNTLYYGDNLDILRRYVETESVDLIYLDPPFNSNATYNVLFAEHDGTKAAAQVKAFEDTWEWDTEAARAYQETVEMGGRVSQAMQAFRTFLGESNMLAYLAMMAPRLVELHRVLKPTGSIYLHCDPTASHYLKMLMDAVFGARNFRNEIVWHYSGWNKKLRHHFERRSDTILFYSRTDAQLFHAYSVPWDSPQDYVRVRKQKLRYDEDGRAYVHSDAGNGQRIKRYVEDAMAEGRYVDNVWDIDKLNNSAKEALGYPTQKPEALLERIIQASSNEGDTVLDPFCGCGTTIAVAQRLKRRWIGIDITCLATALIKHRLQSAFGESVKDSYTVIGEPVSLPDAEELARTDPYQFQWWAVGLFVAHPVEEKKGADKGIDGRLYFHDDPKGTETRQIIFSVKAGKTSVPHLRDLRGVLDRENAQIGVLITMQEPTKAMRKEAASGGFYESRLQGTRHPRLQILTIAELLEGKRIDCPPLRTEVTFRQAPRAKQAKPGQVSPLVDVQPQEESDSETDE